MGNEFRREEERKPEREAEARHLLVEVGAAMAALITLLVVELMLFGVEQVSDDAADIVTLCGFGGLTASVCRRALGPAGQGLASLTLGLIASLAVLHGARSGTRIGLLVEAAGTGKLTPFSVSVPAVVVGITVAFSAWYIQIVLDVPAVTRTRIVLATLFCGVGAAGLSLAWFDWLSPNVEPTLSAATTCWSPQLPILGDIYQSLCGLETGIGRMIDFFVRIQINWKWTGMIGIIMFLAAYWAFDAIVMKQRWSNLPRSMMPKQLRNLLSGRDRPRRG